uniref:Putative secreted peptide n=1 Tax=Anopheles braziliensis TaxID=58242 RepID=A0A2M3ZSL6_9DIPT
MAIAYAAAFGSNCPAASICWWAACIIAADPVACAWIALYIILSSGWFCDSSSAYCISVPTTPPIPSIPTPPAAAAAATAAW